MGKITTVLFDYDGTLMDTDEIIISSWKYTYKKMTGEDLAVETILESFGEPLRETMCKYFSGEMVDQAMEIHRTFQTETYFDKIQMFPGMREVVLGLKERGYRLAVVTSRRKPTTIMGLEKFGLMEVFDCVVTADDTIKHKPDPQPALFAMECLGSKPEETAFVGDTIYDILCGKGAGVTTVMATWAMAAQKGPQGADPDEFIHAAEDLWKVLEGPDAK